MRSTFLFRHGVCCFEVSYFVYYRVRHLILLRSHVAFVCTYVCIYVLLTFRGHGQWVWHDYCVPADIVAVHPL